MFDLLIQGGRVIDGTGTPWFLGDVGVLGGRIAEIGQLRGRSARHTVNADGCIVCPGFFDLHTHSDLDLFADPLHECKLRQGITTEVLGHDGLGLAPVTSRTAAVLRERLASWNGEPDIDWNWSSITTYLDRFEETTAVNVAMLVPHGTVRMAVMGMADGRPTPDQLTRMKRLVDLGMKEGAVGLSTGLTYVPAMYADDAEVVDLCKALRPYHGFYCPHHRNYGIEVLQACYDCIETSRRARVPLHLTHCHVSTPSNRGRAGELLAAVDQARRDGVEVTLDSYPYLAGNTYLHSLLPSWVQKGETNEVLDRLRIPEIRSRVRHEVEVTGSDGFFGMPVDWEMIQIGSILGEGDPGLAGQSLLKAAALSGKTPFDLFLDLVIQSRFRVSCLVHIGEEGNVREIMCHPAHMVGSDAILIGSRPHPRGWGSHARFLGHYVRDLGLLTWEEGIRKITSGAARRVGALDRGILRPGFSADLTVFAPDQLNDTATYENPISLARGVDWVVVNGKIVLERGSPTGLTPGRALRAPYGRTPVRVEEDLSSILDRMA